MWHCAAAVFWPEATAQYFYIGGCVMRTVIEGRVKKAKLGCLGFAVLALVGVACGSAAAPAEQPEDAAATQPASAAQPTAVVQPADAPSEVAVNPGKLTIMNGDWRNERFDYAYTGDPSYLRLLHGSFIAGNQNNEMSPGIASAWDISEDGLTWTFNVRKGVKFHDGNELTMEDVLWSWQHYYSPGAVEHVEGKLAQDVSRITETIELTGTDQISLTTNIPYAGLASDWSEVASASFGIMPRREQIWDKAVETAFDENPIGTGVMWLVSHNPATKMTFERFDDYYYQPDYGLPEDRRVKFSSLDLLLVPEEATRVAAIRSGEADIVPVSLESKKQVEAGGGRLVFAKEGAFFYVWQLGCWDSVLLPPCRDKRVRHALAYALNKELLRDTLYGPEVMEIQGWEAVSPSTIGYSPDLAPFPYDPDRARQLLAEAGYPDGKAFGPLIINTWPAPTSPLLPESAQIAADMWKKELNLEVEVRVGDRSAMTERRQDGQFAGQIVWSTSTALPDATRWVRSMYGTPGRIDRLHNEAELFDLVTGAGAVFQPDRRQQAMNDMFERLYDEHYAIALGTLNIPWAVGPRVSSWQPWPLADFVYPVHTITLE
jgi:peptide/nickel transport system substrate-binding protein